MEDIIILGQASIIIQGSSGPWLDGLVILQSDVPD